MVRIVTLPPPAVLHTPKPPVASSSHGHPDPTLARPDSWECQARPVHFVSYSSGRECPLPPLPRSLGLRNFPDLYPEPDSPCTPRDSLESLLRNDSSPTIEKSSQTPVWKDSCGGRGGGHLQLCLSGSDFMRPFTPSFLFSTMFAEDSPEGYVFRDSPLENIEDSVEDASLAADDWSSEDDSDLISSSCTLLGEGWLRWELEGEWGEGTEYDVQYWGLEDGEDEHREGQSSSSIERDLIEGHRSCSGRLEDVSGARIRTYSSRLGRSCLKSLLCLR
ncbi:hypothetical protein C8T65DRAFT_675288 [Cerioporus squamosus]|nr:hypothetical protein C8T65DRAFT_675288 [Cerioporus squamosus]